MRVATAGSGCRTRTSMIRVTSFDLALTAVFVCLDVSATRAERAPAATIGRLAASSAYVRPSWLAAWSVW